MPLSRRRAFSSSGLLRLAFSVWPSPSGLAIWPWIRLLDTIIATVQRTSKNLSGPILSDSTPFTTRCIVQHGPRLVFEVVHRFSEDAATQGGHILFTAESSVHWCSIGVCCRWYSGQSLVDWCRTTNRRMRPVHVYGKYLNETNTLESDLG